jgi:thioredoxin-related protein
VKTRIALSILGTLAVLSAPAAATGAGESWHDDYDKAAEAARREGKDLLVDFTGSDWCGWCIKLHKEVFAFEEFTAAARKDYVLLALDYPRKEPALSKVPNPERNQELAQKYGIQGFPTVLLMTADGEVYAQTGYQAGGVESYVAHLTEIRAKGREALVATKRVIAAFSAAEGDAKLAAWEEVMKTLEGLDAGSPFVAQLAEPARWALQADPRNERGLKLRALKALMAAGLADDEILAAGRELDPKNEAGLLEQAVSAQFQKVDDDTAARAALEALDHLAPLGFKDKEIGFRLHLTAASWCAGPLQDRPGVVRHAEAAKAIGSQDPQALQVLEQLLAG